jgi:thiol-disulfide isomerase/thioredoxin
MNRIVLVLIGFVLASATTTLAQEKADGDKTGAIALKVVNYADLGKAVKDLKGKVVVVDFWSDTCIPCKRNFPHIVDLNAKHAKDGLVAISVSLDDAQDEAARAKALKFLTARKAAFANLILDEKPEVWQQKLQAAELPLIFVFDRAGKAYKFNGETLDLDEVDQLIDELLQKK